jgi:hypothetical protein
MSTRTTGKRGLTQRVVQRDYKKKIGSMGFYASTHVRAELDRLARRIRKLPTPSADSDYGLLVRECDVLALIRQAKR